MKTGVCVLALSAVCSLLPSTTFAAQPTSGAPGMAGETQVSPAQVYVKLLIDQSKEVISAAEAMPADKYSFAPTHGTFEGVRTFGQQVAHIAASQYYFTGNFGPKTSVSSDAIQKLTGKEDIVKALKDSYAYAQQALETMTAENAFTVVATHGGTRAGLAASMLAHTNDHYGQMVVYLRMNKIVPPASRKP